MRLIVLLAAATLLVCLSLHTSLPSTDVSIGESGVSRSTILYVEATDASAFDDDEDDTPIQTIDDDDEPIPTQTRTPSKSTGSKKSTKSASSTTVTNFDDDDDVDELLADEDEFVGGTTEEVKPKGKKVGSKGSNTKSSTTKKKSNKKEKLASSPVDTSEPTVENVINAPQTFFQPIGWPEYLGVAFVILYIINYIIGSSRNAKIATQFSSEFQSIFQEQFAYIGTAAAPVNANAPPPADEGSFTLEKESEYTYKLYASGRRYCSGLLLTLNLKKRQDLLSILLSFIDLAPTQDTAVIEVGGNEEDMDAFSFAIVQKKLVKKFQKEHDPEAILTVSKNSKPALEKSYAVLNELSELEGEILNDRFIKLLTQSTEVEKHFLSLMISDQIQLPWSSSKRVLRLNFVLPRSYNGSKDSDDTPVSGVTSILRTFFLFLDRLGAPVNGEGAIKLTPAMKAKVDAKRKKLSEAANKASAKERAELLQNKKLEQQRKEKEIIAKDPTSELAKELLRKQEKKQLKMEKKAKGGNVKVMR